jgi:hypothetical protein
LSANDVYGGVPSAPIFILLEFWISQAVHWAAAFDLAQAPPSGRLWGGFYSGRFRLLYAHVYLIRWFSGKFSPDLLWKNLPESSYKL